MASGIYGTIRPADVSPEDVDIILNLYWSFNFI
jgi:hypothetical protein